MKKTSVLQIRIDPNLHQLFLNVCTAQDRPAAQVIRDFMRQYVEMNGGGLQLELFNDSTSFKLVNK